jgi:hypothetical protein
MNDRFRRLLHWRIWLAVIVAVGAGRIGFYYLIYEPVANLRSSLVGEEFEPLRPFLTVPRAGYLSDEPVDSNPSLPRSFDKGDMMYARAQYALAPVVLAQGFGNLPLVVASFSDPAGLDRAIASERFEVLIRPAPAIALLRRK